MLEQANKPLNGYAEQSIILLNTFLQCNGVQYQNSKFLKYFFTDLYILVPRARRFLVTWSGNDYKLSRVALGTRMWSLVHWKRLRARDIHKFALCKYGAKKVPARRKSKAKMVNTAFAYRFTWGCKFVGKCGIYHLCLWFNFSLHFFCTIFALS